MPLTAKVSRGASVTLSQAREIALKTYPGKIVSEELEKESGGSGLRYSFVIRHNTAKHEVGIDAKTGAVLENSVEGKNPDEISTRRIHDPSILTANRRDLRRLPPRLGWRRDSSYDRLLGTKP